MKLVIHDVPEDFVQPYFNTMDIHDEDSLHVIATHGDIHHCLGCFGCWIKTPGTCLLRDGYQNLGIVLSQCDELIVISKCVYGGYSARVKSAIDRLVPYSHPYFAIRNQEMHHQQRYQHHFTMKTLFYGDNISQQEQATANALIKANAVNLECTSYSVVFINTHVDQDGQLA